MPRTFKQADPLAAGECLDGEDCAAHRAGLPKRSNYELTLPEEVTLEAVRLLLSTYVTADARYWDGAVEFTEVNLGETDGLNILVHVTRFVRALQRDRQGPFNFLTFGCQHISHDELAMISALQAARMGPASEFADAIQHLALAPTCPRLERSVMALSGAVVCASSPPSHNAFDRGRASPANLH